MIDQQSAPPAATVPIAFAVAPSGEVRRDPHPPPESTAPRELAERLLADLATGPGLAVLELAARHPAEPLPPSLAFFRDLGGLFLAQLCASPELATRGAAVQVACPAGELEARAAAAPPMVGGEYLTEAALESLWIALGAAFRDSITASGGEVEPWFAARNPAWNVLGRVCFHLAENQADPLRPFAFLATYTTKLSREARPQHRPLGQALHDFGAAKDHQRLLALLLPVQRAAEQSPLVRELVDNGSVYQTQTWTADQAHRFLREVPAFEAAGVLVRIPDWWKPRSPPRVTVQVSVGGKKPTGLGLEQLVAFDAGVALDGEPLTAAEWRALQMQEGGLALVRGRWVEVDREKLAAVLAHWKSVRRESGDGLSLLEAMRLLAGTRSGSDAPEPLEGAVADWSRVAASPWLAQALAELRNPESLAQALPGPELRAELRHYQQAGVRWLSLTTGLGLGACLADDMGLGKTIQVLGLLLARKRSKAASGPSLLVAPASLLGNWTAEIERFAPSLRALVVHSSALPAAEIAALSDSQIEVCDLVITTYQSLLRAQWPGRRIWDCLILDEAQAIKNPGARQTRAVKALKSRARIALTGTPVENRALDLWSLFDFLNPGLLGSAAAFGRSLKKLDQRGYGPLRELTRPYLLRRLKTDPKVISDLPAKTEVTAWCGLGKRQAALYQQTVDELARALRERDHQSAMKRRGLVLASLLRLKQICNHPSQWLRDGAFAPEESGKFGRLAALCEEIAARQERVLVFTQFREMTGPLASYLAGLFGQEGLVLHGGTPVKERRALVERFQRGEAPFFVLSLKAGGTGLNLTAAAQVIHFDRWWNPAVEEQATDRAFRIGQTRNVLVHKFVCRGTVEERIDELLQKKRGLAGELLESGAEATLTELGDADLLRTLSLDLRGALDEA